MRDWRKKEKLSGVDPEAWRGVEVPVLFLVVAAKVAESERTLLTGKVVAEGPESSDESLTFMMIGFLE